MSSLEENIQNWIVNETTGLIEGNLKNLPDISTITILSQGKNREIWKFIIKHVKSKQAVAFTKKILLLRRSKKEREKFPDMNSKNCATLKNKVDNAEDKIRFIEHSIKSVIKHISSLNTLVKNSKKENCILSQNCSIFELATLNMKEKNESLNAIIGKLNTLLDKSFANEKTKCFKNLIDQKSSVNASKINQNFNSSAANINSILNEMILFLKQRLLDENENLPVANLVAPVTEMMSYTLIADVVNLLKNISQQDSIFLQNNIEKNKQEKIVRLSETYLQSMKQAHVDSCFQTKKLDHYVKCLSEKNDVFLNKDIGKLLQDYLSLHIENECFANSIQHLEKKLESEQDVIENLKNNNAEQRSQCQDIEIIMGNFNKKLKTVHILFDQTPQAFSSIKLSLDSCRMFIDTQILFLIKCNKEDCLIDVVNKIDCDYKLSLELLKNKKFLQDFPKDFTFVKQNFPAKVWKFLSLEAFQNRHLLIERLSCIKTKLSLEPNRFDYKPGEMSSSTAKHMMYIIEDNTDNLEVVKKNLFEVKKSCKNLEIVLKDWWDQSAQYIPEIEYHGKTLKMWLAVLNVLE